MNDAELLVASEGVADDLLQTTVQVGDRPLVIELLECDMQFADYFGLLQDDVLAANLLDGEQRDHVGVKEALHDLAEEVGQLEGHGGFINRNMALVLGECKHAAICEELDSLSELLSVEFDLV